MGFLELAFDEAAGQAGCVDRCGHITQEIGKGANVIFVTMGNQNGFDLIPVLN